MKKIEINYDFIEKIEESEGKFTIKKFVKSYPIYTCNFSLFLAGDVLNALCGFASPKHTVASITGTCLIGAYFGFLLNSFDRFSSRGLAYLSKEENADVDLKELLSLLIGIDIDVSLENFKESYVYDKKYKFGDNGKVGIIRERYIFVPTENEYNDVSIKEEHVIGSRQYVLSMDTPKKQVAYKPTFNV